jgi:hypothetical protein
MTKTSNLNPWGTPIVPAENLTRIERIELLRRAAKSLARGKVDKYTGAWLADVLEAHLANGRDLEALLGVRPPQGCTQTAQRLTAAEKHAKLLLQLSAAVGGDRQAARVLAGTAPCPARARGILAELQASPGPTSLAAFSRARGVSSLRP